MRPAASRAHALLNPPALGTPTGPWSHGVVIDSGQRWLVTTGQVALAPDGTVPDDDAAQAERVWERLLVLLAEAGMDVSDIARTGVFATSPKALAAFNVVRNRVLGAHAPATTAIIVTALASPRYRIEADLIACRLS